MATRKGAKEYIDVSSNISPKWENYIRMDFLSWYENGSDRGLGVVGRGYGRDVYKQALQYICESAQKYGVFTSLVMPHLLKVPHWRKNTEIWYALLPILVTAVGDNFRITIEVKYMVHTNSMNMFDGFIHWSKISGRKKVILMVISFA